MSKIEELTDRVKVLRFNLSRLEEALGLYRAQVLNRTSISIGVGPFSREALVEMPISKIVEIIETNIVSHKKEIAEIELRLSKAEEAVE